MQVWLTTSPLQATLSNLLTHCGLTSCQSPTLKEASISNSLLIVGYGLMWLIGAVVYLPPALWVQLPMGNGWLVNKCLRDLAPAYLAKLCRPVVHLTGRRHLRSAASGKLDMQRTATAIGRRNFAVSGPETWNSLPAELHLSTLSTATFAWRLNAHLFVSTEWHVPAARLI